MDFLAAALGRQVPQQDLAPVAQLPAGDRQAPRHLLGARRRRRLRGQLRAAFGCCRHLAAPPGRAGGAAAALGGRRGSRGARPPVGPGRPPPAPAALPAPGRARPAAGRPRPAPGGGGRERRSPREGAAGPAARGGKLKQPPLKARAL